MRKVDFYRHQLGDDEAAAWRDVLGRRFLALGPEVAAFETDFADYLTRDRADVSMPEVVGTNSCSMGLLLALRALGIRHGDEVITTPMTFVATLNAILHAGGKPVLVDVEPTTGLIDPNAVRAAIGPRTVGLLPVHLYGQLCDMRALRALATSHHLFLLEDSAHGVEMERDGIRAGDLGDAAVFSFYATKVLTSGDGGAVATRDREVASRVRRLRNHGVETSAPDRHGKPYRHWDLVEPGYKASLSDLDAALLRPQLRKISDKHSARERLAIRYRSLLGDQLPDTWARSSSNGVGWTMDQRGRSSHHLFTIHAAREEPGESSRDALIDELTRRGVGIAVNYRAVHVLTYFRDYFALAPEAFPVAAEIGDRTLSLPLYPGLSDDEQDYVVETVIDAASSCARCPVS